jgi:hypothetical protein
MQIFDSIVLLILTYSSEVWGFHKAPAIEKVHLKTSSWYTPANSTSAVLDEFERYPLLVLRKVRTCTEL